MAGSLFSDPWGSMGGVFSAVDDWLRPSEGRGTADAETLRNQRATALLGIGPTLLAASMNGLTGPQRASILAQGIPQSALAFQRVGQMGLENRKAAQEIELDAMTKRMLETWREAAAREPRRSGQTAPAPASAGTSAAPAAATPAVEQLPLPPPMPPPPPPAAASPAAPASTSPLPSVNVPMAFEPPPITSEDINGGPRAEPEFLTAEQRAQRARDALARQRQRAAIAGDILDLATPNAPRSVMLPNSAQTSPSVEDVPTAPLAARPAEPIDPRLQEVTRDILGPRPAAPAPAAQPRAAAASNANMAALTVPVPLDRIQAFESGGVPAGQVARNPRSTATGPFQFIEDTWMDFARDNPQRFQGMDRQQILAQRANPEISREATMWLARKNGVTLAQNNLPITPAAIASSHFLGVADYMKVAKADPSTPLTSVLSDKVINSNPHLRTMTAGKFLADQEKRYAGVPTLNAGEVTPAASASPTEPSPAPASPQASAQALPRTSRGETMQVEDPDAPWAQFGLNRQQAMALAQLPPAAFRQALQQIAVANVNRDPAALTPFKGADGNMYVLPRGTLTPIRINTGDSGVSEEIRNEEKYARDEFNNDPFIRQLREVQSRAMELLRANRSAAGDRVRIFNFMKILDPDSTVAPPEVANFLIGYGVEQGLARRIQQYIMGGGTLTDEMRDQIDEQAREIIGTKLEIFDYARRESMDRLTRRGGRSETTIPNYFSPEFRTQVRIWRGEVTADEIGNMSRREIEDIPRAVIPRLSPEVQQALRARVEELRNGR